MEDLHELTAKMRRLAREREERRRKARFDADGKLLPRQSRNQLIASMAIVREPIAGTEAEIWITYCAGREEFLWLREIPDPELQLATQFCDPDALNGYVAFPKRAAPKLPKRLGNIVQYIPVHGGVNYMVKDSYAAVWGFDTMHHRSEKEPRTDQDWIRANCLLLYCGLLAAEQYWPEFRVASQSRRAEIADILTGMVPEQELSSKLGFDAMLNLMAGRIGD